MADEFVFDFCDEAFEGIHVSVSTDPSGDRDVHLKSLPSTSPISTSNIPVQTTRDLLHRSIQTLSCALNEGLGRQR